MTVEQLVKFVVLFVLLLGVVAHESFRVTCYTLKIANEWKVVVLLFPLLFLLLCW